MLVEARVLPPSLRTALTLLPPAIIHTLFPQPHHRTKAPLYCTHREQWSLACARSSSRVRRIVKSFHRQASALPSPLLRAKTDKTSSTSSFQHTTAYFGVRSHKQIAYRMMCIFAYCGERASAYYLCVPCGYALRPQNALHMNRAASRMRLGGAGWFVAVVLCKCTRCLKGFGAVCFNSKAAHE